MSSSLPPIDDALVRSLAEQFALGPVQRVRALGGTATPKLDLVTGQGRFVLRARPAEFAAPEATAFDHAVLARLHAARFPVPAPRSTRDGPTWLRLDEAVYEVLTWVDGQPYVEGDCRALEDLGRMLARWHRLMRDAPLGKNGWPREDHPDLMRRYLADLRRWAGSAADRAPLDRVEEQLDLVRRRLDDDLYGRLPKAVIHGDVHPGNVRFRDGMVSAVYDFDYLSLQARLRDLSDAMILFGSRRPVPLDPDAIRSLTQAFRPEGAWCRTLVAAYQSFGPLVGDEWQALPLLVRSRWLQMRLRGARKVAAQEKVAFVLDRLFEVIDWLDSEADGFFRGLR